MLLSLRVTRQQVKDATAILSITTVVCTKHNCQVQLNLLDPSDNLLLQIKPCVVCSRKELNIQRTEVVETVILSKDALTSIIFLTKVNCFSITNGGFYPPTVAAEFQYLYYPNSLRRYERPPNYKARCSSALKVRSSQTTGLINDAYTEK